MVFGVIGCYSIAALELPITGTSNSTITITTTITITNIITCLLYTSDAADEL